MQETDEKNMQTVTDSALANELIAKALKGEHYQLGLIRNIEELKVARTLASGVKKLVMGFEKAKNSAFKAYLESVKAGEINRTTLFAYKTLSVAYDFYFAELHHINHIIAEYRAYLYSGHLAGLIGKERDEQDMIDFLTLEGDNT